MTTYKSNRDRIMREIRRGAYRNVQAAVNVWHSALMDLMRGTRSGRVYFVPGTRQPYTASAPGEPPAIRTGELRSSYRPVAEENRRGAVGRLGTPLPRGLWLELGTRRMAPRPHLRPAGETALPRIRAHLSKRVL